MRWNQTELHHVYLHTHTPVQEAIIIGMKARQWLSKPNQEHEQRRVLRHNNNNHDRHNNHGQFDNEYK